MSVQLTRNNSVNCHDQNHSESHTGCIIGDQKKFLIDEHTSIVPAELEAKLVQMSLDDPNGVSIGEFYRFAEEAFDVTDLNFIQKLFNEIAAGDTYISIYDMFQAFDLNQDDVIDIEDRLELQSREKAAIESANDETDPNRPYTPADIEELITQASILTDGNSRLSCGDLRCFIDHNKNSDDPEVIRLVELARVLKDNFKEVKGDNRSIERDEAINFLNIPDEAMQRVREAGFTTAQVDQLIHDASFITDGNHCLSCQDLRDYICDNRNSFEPNTVMMVELAKQLYDNFREVKGNNNSINRDEALEYIGALECEGEAP